MISQRSEKVKRWRRNTKERIIQSMGGKCQICGYNKCQGAMDLHHLDPSKKEISFAKIRRDPKAWIKIVEELRKCILLCNRCHQELHNGMTQIPKKYSSFNEDFVEYKKILKNEKTFCPICGKEKSFMNKTCSYSCASKLQYSFDWDKIDLEGMYKGGMSISKICDEIGCSFPTVKKRLIKMKLL